MKKTKSRKKVKKSLEPKPSQLVLINLKVRRSHLVLLDKKAEELTNGNRSKLLLLSALNRKTPFGSVKTNSRSR